LDTAEGDATLGAAATEELAQAGTFDFAPVSLWLEDLSDVKKLFLAWEQEGMVSLRDYLRQRPDCLKACMHAIRILKVNRKTLELYEARTLDDLLGNMDKVIVSGTGEAMVEEFHELWEGKLEFFSKTVNNSLTGRRLDIHLHGHILPGFEESWARVLVSVEDVSDLHKARREIAKSEAYARGLFEHSPVSLWVLDLSRVKQLVNRLRHEGIWDIEGYFSENGDFIETCIDAIVHLDINHQTLKLYNAPDKLTFWANPKISLRPNLLADFKEQVIGLWNGELFQERETINYRIDGTAIYVNLQFSVLPGHEDDWSLVQVARTDVSARKAAEIRLEYLRNHDTLTHLYSRSFYNEELRRLDASVYRPVSIIIADLNGLKAANDRLGHAAGDGLIRDAAAILERAVHPPWFAARVGGDEFSIVLPEGDEADADRLIADISALIEERNRKAHTAPLSLSLGAATREAGESLEATVSRADARMYESKRCYYQQYEYDRRAG
jgi:diguanylate cyclase (GGDEF)-like protein